MDQNTISILATAGVSSVTGVLGYLLREYNNKAKPFISVMEIESDLRDRYNQDSMPQQIIDLANSISQITMTEIGPLSTNSEVKTLRNDISQLIEHGQKLVDAVDKCLASIKEDLHDKSLQIIRSIIEDDLYESWIIGMLLANVLDLPEVAANQSQTIKIIEEQNMHSGCYFVAFKHGSRVTFGKGLNKSAILKVECRRFLELINSCDFEAISTVLTQYKDAVQKAISVARQIQPDVESFLNSQSRWGVKLYIANLGSTPILIKQKAVLRIKNSDGANRSIQCNLVVFRKDNDGENSKYLADGPAILPSEQNIIIEFTTAETQAMMEDGLVIRQIFNAKRAKCWIDFDIERVGYFRNQSLSTPKVSFA